MVKYIVTGSAGFIGSTLVDRLLDLGDHVVGIDNYSTGRQEFLSQAEQSQNFHQINADLMNSKKLDEIFATHQPDMVFHLAANADVRYGTDNPSKDLEQNTIATFNVLNAMRLSGVNRIAFSSTGSIYGEAEVIPTPEDAPFPVQTSLYGASKLAGEGLIQAFAEGYGFNTWIFRFVSILGERYTHGHIFDFCQKLMNDPHKLPILGDGMQDKSYMYVQDCIDAMLAAIEHSNNKVNIFNLGVEDSIKIKDSARIIADVMQLSPEFSFEAQSRGWVGDNPRIQLDVSRIQSLGWKPRVSIEDGVKTTLNWILKNQWVFD